jgi:predicted outer membrane protein
MGPVVRADHYHELICALREAESALRGAVFEMRREKAAMNSAQASQVREYGIMLDAEHYEYKADQARAVLDKVQP